MKTVHYYNVYANNFGAPGEFVQFIKLFRLNANTIRVASAIKTSNVPASWFHIAKDTGALHYVPKCNHVGYILEEYNPLKSDTPSETHSCALAHQSSKTCGKPDNGNYCYSCQYAIWHE